MRIRIPFLFLFVFASQFIWAQEFHHSSSVFMRSGDIFGTRNFAENRGQFKPIDGKEVLYALDNGNEKIFFTKSGVIYQQTERQELSERTREKIEEGEIPVPQPKTRFVSMNWKNCSQDILVEATEQQKHYLSYGEAIYNSAVFKKLTYLEVYPHIDIEYIIPEDKEYGIKYSVILHPGANLADLQMEYGGDLKKMVLNKNGEVTVKTDLDEIIEHAPLTFNRKGDTIPSKFLLEDNKLSFDLNNIPVNEEIVIDPWISMTTTLTSTSWAFDIDYDYLGNVYVYGGFNNYKVAMFNNLGVLQWCFQGSVSSQSWASNGTYAGNFGVNKFNSKTFVAHGFFSTGNRVIRLDASGNYDNWINSANSQWQEVWDMGFHCLTAEVFVLGGGTTSNISAVTVNTVNATFTMTTFQPANNAAGQDVVSHAIDDQGNIFVIYAGASAVNNRNCLINSGFNNNIWTQPSTFSSFQESNNKGVYVSNTGVLSNGFNALAVNANFLFYYDGYNIAAYNKGTGALVASTTVPGFTLKRQGGIAVDDCNNLYLGGVGNVLSYNFNGTAFSTLTPLPLSLTITNQYVADIKLDKQLKVLYVSGSGFAGVIQPVATMACQTASSMCLFSQGGISVVTTSVTCANLGSGTCTAVGGTGPFTYTWLPSMQTGSVAINLQPGNHAIAVTDQGANVTYTANAYLPPLVPFTGSVSSSPQIDCFGVNNGTAAVINLNGGSGNQNYTWYLGTTTATTSSVSNLGPGTYSVNVVDALTSCSISSAFTVVAPPALSLNISASAPSICVNSSVMLTPFPAGGTPAYSFSWSNGPTTGANNLTESVGGSYVYSLTLSDSKNCALTKTIGVTFVSGPTITITNASICPGQTGTVSCAGALTYTWNGGSATGPSITANPGVTTVYTVAANSGQCVSMGTATITLKSPPTPGFSSNAPVCSGQTLQVSASGGTNAVWSGPLGFNALGLNASLPNPNSGHTGTYNFTLTGANSCTALGTGTALVRALPTISALGSTVCIINSSSLSANSNASPATYFWSGPNGYASSLQNPVFASTSMGSGQYSVTVTDGNACSNSAVANVTITAQPVPSFTVNTPICESFQLNFNASSSNGALVYQWAGPNAFVSGIQNPSISNASPAASGIYTLYTTAGPCQTSTTRTVAVHPLPLVSASANVTTCVNHGFTLNANSTTALTYKWYTPSSGSSLGSVYTNTMPALSAMGIYTIQVTDVNSCSNTTTVAVTVYTNPVISVPSLTTCLYNSAHPLASGAASYTWTCPLYFTAVAGQMNIPKVTQALVNISVMGTAANGCTSSATSSVEALPLPVPAMQLSPGTSVCQTFPINMTGTGGIKYEWRGPLNFFLEGQQVNFSPMMTGASGNYTLTVIDKNGCRSSLDTFIQVKALPDGQMVSTAKNGCVPFCTEFTFLPSNGNTIQSKWTVNGLTKNSNIFSACFDAEGEFILRGQLFDPATGCSNVATYSIVANAKPKADFSHIPDAPVEKIDEILFTSTSGGDQIVSTKWFYEGDKKGAGFEGLNLRYTYPDAGNYPVALVVKNKWGCMDTVVKSVIVLEDFLIYVPNAFSPNGDGNNDTFFPVSRGTKAISMQVYDRWGELLYSSNSLDAAWDGTFKGKVCKEDSYIWKIIATSKTGQSKEFNGHVSLLR